MTARTSLPFRNMHGLGNRFLVLDARARDPNAVAALGKRAANSRSGLSCDQLIIVEPSARADAFMRIFNADGSEAGACGNAARCVAWLLAGETGRSSVTLETAAGLLSADVAGLDRITVDMGEPRFDWRDIPLAEPQEDTREIALQAGPIDGRVLRAPSAVSVGNPHAIFWVEDVDAYDLGRFGPLLERHPMFPERANISLATVRSRAALRVRTWERGAGLTQACGTAACAAAVAAARKGLTDRLVAVTLPGGSLTVEWTASGRMFMTGPAALDGEGEIAVEDELELASGMR